MSLRILGVHDHGVVRRGVGSMFESREGWEVWGEATTGRDGVEQSRRVRPHVVVMDLSLPELNGLDATRQILKDTPDTEVLVLTMHHSEELAREVLRAGARGFILKADADENLITAVESLRQHRPFLTPTVTGLVLDDYLRSSDGDVARDAVTPREREVMQLVAEGQSSKEIASTPPPSVTTISPPPSGPLRARHLMHLQGVGDRLPAPRGTPWTPQRGAPRRPRTGSPMRVAEYIDPAHTLGFEAEERLVVESRCRRC